MSDAEDFATLFARESARAVLEIGQVVKGRVIQISAESVFVDVGGKGEAWIERAELTDGEGKLRVAVGDEVEATVVSTGDEIRLSHKLRQGAQARQALAMAAQTGIPVEGKVAAVIKGGYEVTVGGLRGFCPFSQMDLRRVETTEEYVGRVLEFRVTTFSENGRNLVLSRRRLLEEHAAEAAEETRKELLPGVDGLLHITEIPRSRQGALRESAANGAEITVLIVSIDREKRRIALALAPEGAELGQQMESLVEVGAVLTGTVERHESFGVFVRLGPGQTGLVPTGEPSLSRGADPRKTLPADTEIKVLVLAIEEGGRRIRLSHAQALAREEQAETQAYMQQSPRRGDGFGLTLGERVKPQGSKKRL